MSQITNEAAFLQALGINPSTVEANTVKVQMVNGQNIVTFGVMIPVTAATLGHAFLAASAAQEDSGDDGEKDGSPPDTEGEGRE